MRHFLTLADFSKDEILEILSLAHEIKAEVKRGEFRKSFENRTLAMIFEKNSTRTRVSFEVGFSQLGGKALFLSANDSQIGRGEPLKDTARVISSMCDMVMMRTSAHSRLVEFAQYSSVPLINGLSDDFHPMQLLADFMTIQECGLAQNPEEPIVTWIGDGNNMAHSWLMLAAKLGFNLRLAMPKNYSVKSEILTRAMNFAKESGAKIQLFENPKEAASGANVITTDTWASMGQESEKKERESAFAGFCVDEKIMQIAQKNAIFLHCLPAYRGQEVSESVIEGAQSRVFLEAQNRLHAQKGAMLWLHQQK